MAELYQVGANLTIQVVKGDDLARQITIGEVQSGYDYEAVIIVDGEEHAFSLVYDSATASSTILNFAISASITSALEIGLYPMRLRWTSTSGERRTFINGFLQVV